MTLFSFGGVVHNGDSVSWEPQSMLHSGYWVCISWISLASGDPSKHDGLIAVLRGAKVGPSASKLLSDMIE